MYRNGCNEVSVICRMLLYGANDLINIFVALEWFSLCSYILFGYTEIYLYITMPPT